MTERLFHQDAYLREFHARVVSTHGGEGMVELDRTAFYATAGGQPHDTGVLDGLRVIEVIDEGERILHRLALGAQSVAALVGQQITGRIDWDRRFDHMQQHTGQHILSQAALRVLDAETFAAHLGFGRCTMDLSVAAFTAEEAARVEDAANAVVMESRQVRIHNVGEAEVGRLGLRRPPKKTGTIRVVEIEEFDRSACGGTHVRMTGEVGVIAITGWERYKGGTRVEFLCGWRAVRDHRWKTQTLMDLSRAFSVGAREVGEAAARLAAREREASRRAEEALQRLVALEADVRRRELTLPGVVTEVFVGRRDPEEVRALAQALVRPGGLIVLLGADAGRLVFARSADVALDVTSLLRRITERFGGRGGGRPDLAQGSVAEGADLSTVLDTARAWAEEGLAGA